MRRVLIFVAVLYLVWRLLSVWSKGLGARSRGAEDFSSFSAKRRKRGDAGAEELVACSVCGTHVPDSSLVSGPGGRLCCSDACLKRLRSASVDSEESPAEEK